MDSSRTLPADVSRGLLEDLLGFKALYDAAARVAAEGFVHVDACKRVARFNAAAEMLTGFAESSVLGKPFCDLLHEDNASDPLDESATHEPRATRLMLRDSRGGPVDVRARSLAMANAGGIEGWLVAFAPKEAIDEIEQLKNELISTVSHELKTPLAAIKAYTATLRQNPALYETHRDEFLGVVEQQADRLSRLVDDMLLVSRVETAQMLRRRMLVPLDEILDEALADVATDPQAHPLVRRTNGVRVSGDPERLRDVFRNLLENAVKYSPRGGEIEISAHSSGDQTVIEIRDRGVGIASEHLPYIFDRFYRVDSEATAGVGGSGLGLYIVSALVRAHGGTIDVRSEERGGSVFTLRLPVRA